MLWIMETYVNKDQHALFGETDPYETFTEDLGRLFRSLQQEHGRCTGKQYTEYKDGHSVQSGWVFEKRKPYQDAWSANDTYLQETWITVWSDPPQHIPEHWTGGTFAFA